MRLSLSNRQILECLSEVGGYETGIVSRYVNGQYGNKHSAQVRQLLLKLEKQGLVKKADDKKPVLWERTENGTHILKSSRDRATDE